MGQAPLNVLENAEAQLQSMRDQRRRGPGLRLQLLLSLATILMVTVVLISAVVLKLGEGNLIRQKVDSGVMAATLISQSVRAGLDPNAPLWSPSNLDHARRVAALGAQHPEVTKVTLLDASMTPVVTAPRLTRPQALTQPQQESEAIAQQVFEQGRPQWFIVSGGPGQGRTLRVWTALMDASDRRQGVLGLELPMWEVDDRIAASKRLMLLYLLLDAAALLALGYLLLTRLIVRPIDAIGQATWRVARGDYSPSLRVRSSNEIGRLAEDFNAMTGQLQRHRDALEERIEALSKANQELAQAQQSLMRSEKLATVGRLAAGVAHEIGNPLSAVLGYVELLEDGGIGPEEDADLLRRVDKELHRIDGIVRGLLDYSRAEAQGRALCSLTDLIESSVQLVEAQPRFRGIDLQRHIAPSLGLVEINEGRMQQVVVNLLLNAADAMGGAGTIHITARAIGTEHLELEVRDTGPGIAPDAIDHLFEPFFTTKPPGEGTGLGLAICHSIVESFEGRLEASNAPEGGAAFAIVLPAHRVSQD